MWERVLDSVETGNLDAIAREIDRVAKYQLIEEYRARHGLPLSSPAEAICFPGNHPALRKNGCTDETGAPGSSDPRDRG